MKTLVLTIAILLIAQPIQVQASCSFQDANSGKSYDLSNLYKQDNWKVVDGGSSEEGNLFSVDYLFNFCEPVQGFACNGKSNLGIYRDLIVLGQSTDACEVLGLMDSSHTTITPKIFGNGEGLELVYDGGDICVGSENSAQDGLQKKATFNIICAENTDDNFVQSPVNSNTVTKCTPEFTIRSPAGCNGRGSNKWSYFYWFCFFVAIYMGVGMYLNIKNKGKSGMEAIPHIDTFRKVPGAVSGLVGSVVNKANEARGSSGKSSKNTKYTLV